MKNLTFVISNDNSYRAALNQFNCLGSNNVTIKDLTRCAVYNTRADAEAMARTCGFKNIHNTNMQDLITKINQFGPKAITVTGKSKAAIIENFGRFIGTFNGTVASHTYTSR